MKKFYLSFICFQLFLFLGAQAQQTFFKGVLQGSQEVPANASTATGVVIVRYNTATNQLILNADFQGLAANLSATHIHNAAAGSNGPVIYNLNFSGNTTSGTLSLTQVITDAQETELLAGRLYVNVHNATFPGGEVRAQLTEATVGQTIFYNAIMNGGQESPPVSTTAVGVMNTLLDKGAGVIYNTGSFTGLSANATASHLHKAAAGSNGPVAVGLTITTGVTAGVISGSANVTSQQIADIEAGLYYCNVHSSSFPGGEIRGQLAAMPIPQTVYFAAIMSAAQEVPSNASLGTGVTIVQYDLGTNRLILNSDFQKLGSQITATHIHNAAAGVNGGVMSALTFSGTTSGSITGTPTLTDAQEAELLAGRCYINVHSTNFPGGEIRGQLNMTTLGNSFFATVPIDATQEVPTNASTGTGTAFVLNDKGGAALYVTGSFTGLAANATNGHIHKAAAGANGAVVVPFTIVTGATSGVFSAAANMSTQQQSDLDNGLYYVNVHSSLYPGGEIRGQIFTNGYVALPVKLISFNGFKNRQNVSLRWETANQVNLKQFAVEELNPAANAWVKKSVVSANTASLGQLYTTEDVPAFGGEMVYYRLKMEDIDGHVSYSSIVRINFKTGSVQLVINANPVQNNKLKFLVAGQKEPTKAEAVLVDFSGRVMRRSMITTGNQTEWDISNLAKGMYKLVVTVNNNKLESGFLKE